MKYLLIILLLLLMPLRTNAQELVIDPFNLAKNTITAAQMLIQVLNSTKEVKMMIQNLQRTSGEYEETARLMRRLDEVLSTGEALHYQLSHLDQTMHERYPGYHNPGRWVPAYDQWTTTSLDTLRGTLNTVHEQLMESERAREEANLTLWKDKTSNAQGNLDAQQTSNMIEIQSVEEQRKIRQLLGALINAQNVATAHQINLQASRERIINDWLERSQMPVTPYSGQVGFGPDDYRH